MHSYFNVFKTIIHSLLCFSKNMVLEAFFENMYTSLKINIFRDRWEIFFFNMCLYIRWKKHLLPDNSLDLDCRGLEVTGSLRLLVEDLWSIDFRVVYLGYFFRPFCFFSAAADLFETANSNFASVTVCSNQQHHELAFHCFIGTNLTCLFLPLCCVRNQKKTTCKWHAQACKRSFKVRKLLSL